jgi:hypothetical protein
LIEAKNERFLFEILAFLHFIAALRSKKTGEISEKKNILQPIKKVEITSDIGIFMQ